MRTSSTVSGTDFGIDEYGSMHLCMRVPPNDPLVTEQACDLHKRDFSGATEDEYTTEDSYTEDICRPSAPFNSTTDIMGRLSSFTHDYAVITSSSLVNNDIDMDESGSMQSLFRNEL